MSKRYRNDGPPMFVVELQREVQPGEEFEGSDALALSAGLTPLTDKPAAPIPSPVERAVSDAV